MAGRKDRAIEYRDQQIPPGLIFPAKCGDQGQGNDIDDVDRHHSAHRAGGIDLRPLLNVLRQRAAEGAVRDIDAGIAEDQQAVGDIHIDRLGPVGPGGMRPEGQHQDDGGQGCADEQPGTVAAPAGLGTVAEAADQGIIDGVPKPGNQHQKGNRSHRDAAYVRIEDHEEIAHEHPAEITAHITEAIGDFADQRDFYVRLLRRFFTRHDQPSFAMRTTAFTMFALSATLLSIAFWISSKSNTSVTMPFRLTRPAATASIAMG